MEQCEHKREGDGAGKKWNVDENDMIWALCSVWSHQQDGCCVIDVWAGSLAAAWAAAGRSGDTRTGMIESGRCGRIE